MINIYSLLLYIFPKKKRYRKLIWILCFDKWNQFFLTGKIQQIDLNLCFDVKTQTNLSVNAWGKVRHFLILVPKIAWLYNWGMLVSGVAGRPPKNICLRSISNFSVSGCAGYWNWRSHLRQIFFGVRPATPDTITVFWCLECWTVPSSFWLEWCLWRQYYGFI